MNSNLAHLQMRIPGSETESSVEDMWPGLFRRMFQPSAVVAKAIAPLVYNHQLQVNNYAAAHLRMRWPVRGGGAMTNMIQWTRNKSVVKWFQIDKANGVINMGNKNTSDLVARIADHAVECAIRVMPEAKVVYVASDSAEVTHYLMHQSPYWAINATGTLTRKWRGTTLQVNTNSNDPTEHGWGVPAWEIPATAKVIAFARPGTALQHFDTMKVWKSPEEGYSTFVDLWLMAHAKCHSTGLGGFGRFGSVLSGNRRKCASRHRDYTFSSPSCASPAERKSWKQSKAQPV